MEQAALRPVDSADVTILVDTCVDVLLACSEVARRAPLAYDWTEGDQLRAEHGYALLLTVQQGERRQSVLYDAGLGRDTAIYNMGGDGQHEQDRGGLRTAQVVTGSPPRRWPPSRAAPRACA
jgi:hypothetical protein